MILQELIANLAGAVRNEKMEDQEYLVAPMVMLCEGVHEGSNGALFYPAEELAKIPEVWNHKPVVVYHPTEEGKPISACYPDVLTKHKIGIIMNTWFDPETKKLRAEAWIDQKRLKKVDVRIHNSLMANQIVEVSTGLFTENESIQGNWNGEEYIGIARNFKPDHLAILPDQIGACSVADGAGLLRINESHKARQVIRQFVLNEKKKENPTDNELAFDEIQNRLHDALRAEYGTVWIESVYEDYVVYELGGMYYKLSYTESDDKITLGDSPEKVSRVVEYRANSTTSNNPPTGNSEMKTKKEIVDNLISKGGWDETDRPVLMAMNEAQLKKIPVANEEPPKGTDTTTTAPPVATDTTTTAPPVANKVEKPVTLQEYVNAAPAEIQEYLNQGMATLAAERNRLVSTLTANVANPFTEDQLKSMPIDQLKGMVALASSNKKVEENHSDPLAYYGGAGFPVANNTPEETPPPLGLPKWEPAKK